MGDADEQNQYAVDEIDWEYLLQNIPESIDFSADELNLSTDPLFEESRSQRSSEPSPDSAFQWIGEMEHFLLEEDKEIKENQEFSENFFSDLLLDVSDDGSSESRVMNNENMDPKANSSGESEAKEKSEASEVKNGGDEDPVSKKRKRQMRNRDSAMKSRERKKMYVRDLEMKNKFMEGECRRLGCILNSYVMENQALHQILQKTKPSRGGGVSSTKQESAVLSLESLLLGSLFWLVSTACLFFLYGHHQEAVLENVGSLGLGGSNIQKLELVQWLREPGNDKFRFLLVSMGRRCKATRVKMKLRLGCLSVSLLAPGYRVRF